MAFIVEFTVELPTVSEFVLITALVVIFKFETETDVELINAFTEELPTVICDVLTTEPPTLVSVPSPVVCDVALTILEANILFAKREELNVIVLENIY